MNIPAPDEAIAALLNAAYEPLRALPRVVPEPVEPALVTPEEIVARRAQGWFGENCTATMRDGKLVALLDFQVTGDEASIGAFVTHPDYQRQGLGSANLATALEAMRATSAATVRTASFVDSRNLAACDCLERAGFTVRDPEHQNIVMQIEMDAYQPLPVELPPGYRIESLRLEWLEAWMTVKNRVFESSGGPDWFRSVFADRWDFEPQGWHVLFHGDEMIGTAGADLHRDPAHPNRYSGCQIEYVAVYSEHRGLRLGEMLVGACLNYAKRLGVKPCQLITQPFRVPAIKLYERLGFRKVRENRTYERLL
ncbi:MAG: GNAT family N-acetyltransferase [Armatimonadia bacterium]